MYDPKYNKPSRGTYQLSGALGCLPSLVFFFLGVSLTSGHYGFPDLGLLMLSFIFGLGGLIGLLVAGSMRKKETLEGRAKDRKQYLDED